MPLEPATRLGAYEIVGPLGAGGMGDVYRARDTRLGREVAIKVLPAEVAANRERLERFEREARTVAGLNHPNIVVLHSIEEQDGVRFLTMELVEGETLAASIAPGGLPLHSLLHLAIPLADALVAAHEKGVVHRDLKPGNVMVTRAGRVKVLDFGLARMTLPASSADLAQAETVIAPISSMGQVIGTVPYMAPEQVRGEAVDARSDLFALGIMLYELATGRRPFTGETAVDVGHAILHATPEPMARARNDLPGEFERIVSRCLAKDPRERIATALEVSNKLHRLRRALERGDVLAPARDHAAPAASMAVLPFANRGASADDEYFSDGLADELITVLAKVKGLRVSARASSFQFKGGNRSLAEIGEALRVETVLDGSVRKAGNRVRISVQLVKVADGYPLWSETYDRTLDDIFAVQDDIAQSVVRELRTALLGEEVPSNASGEARAEVAAAARGRSTDPEAQRMYFQARHLIDRNNRDDLARAIEYLERAVALDPQFAYAWIERGRAHGRMAGGAWVPVDEGYGQARASVDRALAIAPDLAEGHAMRGMIRMYHDFDLRGATEALRHALDLAPRSPLALHFSGLLEVNHGRPEPGIELYRRALEVDPLAAGTYHNLAYAQANAGRFVESEESYRKALELAPQRSATRGLLAGVVHAQGRSEDALAEADREPSDVWRLYARAIICHDLGRAAASDDALGELTAGFADDSAYQIAEVHGARGEIEQAFAWLERARAQRDGGFAGLMGARALRSLHGDQRWRALARTLGLEVES